MYCNKRRTHIKSPEDCFYCHNISSKKQDIKDFDDEDEWHRKGRIIALG